jgi:type I protein arginine methyltransferase
MLLYESMLDSVIVARDRFLSPTGLMAPSQTRIVIAGITADGLIRDRSTFWDSIYGEYLDLLDYLFLDGCWCD